MTTDGFYPYLPFLQHQAVLVRPGDPLVLPVPFGLLVPLDLVHLEKRKRFSSLVSVLTDF